MYKDNIGDIAYWCEQKGSLFSVMYGLISEVFPGVIIIDYIEPAESRLIDGIPIENYVPNTYYKKLPKGWSYGTKLFCLSYRKMSEDMVKYFKEAKIDNPEIIKEGLNKGYLVKSSSVFHGNIEEVITKEGYRIELKYPMWKYRPTGTTLKYNQVYLTYAEAKKEVDNNINEFNRQAALSDRDWSIEQIRHTIDRYAILYSLTSIQRKIIEDLFFNMDNLDDLETRISSGSIEWKYYRSKKWNKIDI